MRVPLLVVVVAAVVVVTAVAAAAAAAAIESSHDELCGVCEDGVAAGIAALGNNASLAEIVRVLDDACRLLPSADRPRCTNAIDGLARQLNNSDTAFALKYSPQTACAILGLCHLDCCLTPYTPEQIHIAYAGPRALAIMWATLLPTPDSTVLYGASSGDPKNPDSWQFSATGSQHTDPSGGWRGTWHTVILSDLVPGQRYYYQCGSRGAATFWNVPNWSEDTAMNFIAQLDPQDQPTVRVATVGDMGGTDMADLTAYHVAMLVQGRAVDFVLNLGDIGYADGHERLWDTYLRKVETSAAYAPFMTIPGNHEGYYSFRPYDTRFRMPGPESGGNASRWYSFDVGPVHFVSITTEGPDGLIPYGFSPETEQYQWLQADLAAVDKRNPRPWVVVSGHRPLYCNEHDKNCDSEATLLRINLEDLLQQYRVNCVLVAHQHRYERSYPMYKGQVLGTYSAPAGVVHIMNGAAGNKVCHGRPKKCTHMRVLSHTLIRTRPSPFPSLPVRLCC
jgi:acid phosphatase type 7